MKRYKLSGSLNLFHFIRQLMAKKLVKCRLNLETNSK